MTKDLFLAILSMDAYNRGYNPGISGLSEVSDGSVQIGTATISFNLDNASLTPQAIAAGFYAVAYEWNGETIISYRGTDNPDLWTDEFAGGSDVWNGYGIGGGSPYAEQGRLAAEFYQAVTGTQTNDPLTGSATLTGHSLGGGLAGLIGALYHEDAVLFDNMPFEWAVNDLYE